MPLEKATFAGGCFWCIEAPFALLPGVKKAVSGYTGGSKTTAVYAVVSTGLTHHKEAVQVTFDPKKVSYEKLLQVFWRQIDPTDSGGQFADRGAQYRTAIFYHSPEQKKAAEKSKKELGKSGLFGKPIATEILPAQEFFPAEEHHQEYYRKNTVHYTSYKQGSGRAEFLNRVWGKK